MRFLEHQSCAPEISRIEFFYPSLIKYQYSSELKVNCFFFHDYSNSPLDILFLFIHPN